MLILANTCSGEPKSDHHLGELCKPGLPAAQHGSALHRGAQPGPVLAAAAVTGRSQGKP